MDQLTLAVKIHAFYGVVLVAEETHEIEVDAHSQRNDGACAYQVDPSQRCFAISELKNLK